MNCYEGNSEFYGEEKCLVHSRYLRHNCKFLEWANDGHAKDLHHRSLYIKVVNLSGLFSSKLFLRPM